MLSGPCQFPTLGFVVSRYEQVQAFRPEQFWYIYLALDANEGGGGEEQEIVFTWSRVRLFEFDVSLAIYEMVLANPMATISSVKRKPTKKWKPLPLTTVELQKSGSRLLKLAPKRILDVRQHSFLSTTSLRVCRSQILYTSQASCHTHGRKPISMIPNSTSNR
jgi:DNA topoisomerase III